MPHGPIPDKPLWIAAEDGSNVSENRSITVELQRSTQPVILGLRTGERIMDGAATVFVQPPPRGATVRFGPPLVPNSLERWGVPPPSKRRVAG